MGVQSCLAIFERRKSEIRRVFLSEDTAEQFHPVAAWAARKRLVCKQVSKEELSRVAGTEHHEGVCFEAKPLRGVAPGQIAKLLSELQRGLLLILEGVENPHNVGAILRTACFFGVDAVILRSQVISDLPGAACRIAEGAAERLPLCIIRDYDNLFSVLRARGFTLVATSPHEARSLYGIKWPDKVALMFGAEGTGLSSEALEAAEVRVTIPRLGPIESVNVGAAVASVLTEARREQVMRGQVRRVQSSAG